MPGSFGGAFFLLGLGLLAPLFTRTSSRGAITQTIINGKQLIIGVWLYAEDHEGKCPHTLQELVDTGVLSRPELDQLLSHPYEKPQKLMDWVYIPDLSIDKTVPNYPVLISPVLQDNAGSFRRNVRYFMGQQPSLFPVTPKRVIAFSDSSVEVINESDFPAFLKRHNVTLPAAETTNTPEK